MLELCLLVLGRPPLGFDEVRSVRHELVNTLPVVCVYRARARSSEPCGENAVLIDVKNEACFSLTLSSMAEASGPRAAANATDGVEVGTGTPDATSARDVNADRVTANSTEGPARKTRGPGRPAVHELCPALVPTVRAFIEQDGSGAQEKRRTSTAQSGVSAPEIQRHVKAVLGEDVSLTTIRRLFQPGHANWLSAKVYKALIDAKVPHKRNDLRGDRSKNAHFANSMVMTWAEFFHRHDQWVLSLDSMNKVCS